MRDRKRNSLWGALGIAGLLVVTSACDNKPSNSASTPGSKNSGGGLSAGGSGSNTQSLGSGSQNDKQVVVTCSDLSQEDCEKTLFGLQRCKKDGDKCVDDPSAKAPESCGDLDEDQCKQSPVCKLNGSDCEDDATWVVAPCNGKNESDCAADATCLVSPYLKTCHKNDKKGRCEFKVELCDPAGACANSYNDGSNDLCEDVAVPDGFDPATCTLSAELCKMFNGTGNAPAAVKLGIGVNASADITVKAGANAVCNNTGVTAAGSTECHTVATAAVGGTWATATEGIKEYVCRNIKVVGAATADDSGTANVPIKDEDFIFPNGKGFKVTAIAPTAAQVNITGWCEWKKPAKTKNICRVISANLKNSTLCKKYTKADCEAVTAIAGNVPCRWVD